MFIAASAGPRVHEDRDLDVASALDISVDAQIERVVAALATRGGA